MVIRIIMESNGTMGWAKDYSSEQGPKVWEGHSFLEAVNYIESIKKDLIIGTSVYVVTLEKVGDLEIVSDRVVVWNE